MTRIYPDLREVLQHAMPPKACVLPRARAVDSEQSGGHSRQRADRSITSTGRWQWAIPHGHRFVRQPVSIHVVERMWESGRGEKPFVEFACRGAGRDTELIAQAVAEVAVDVEGFGEVALGGEGLHQVAVSAFSKGSKPDELAAGPNSTFQFCSCEGEFGGGIAL